MLEFDPNTTTTEWIQRVYPHIKSKTTNTEHQPVIYDCTIYPNEVLFFPDKWMHATLNQEGYNFFVSVFLDKDILDDTISQRFQDNHGHVSGDHHTNNETSRVSLPTSVTENEF